MRIKSQFAGVCKRCGRHIDAGAEIEWSRDYGASHIECWVKFLQKRKEALQRAMEKRTTEGSRNEQ